MSPVLLIVSGPSGVGKTTLVERLLAEFAGQLDRSISITTRDPRPGELIRGGYFFVTEEGFARSVLHKELVEHEHVHGAWYGTPRRLIELQLSRGHDVVAVVEPSGALRLFEEFVDHALMVFIHPPSIDELRKRLLDRGSGELRDRLEVAEKQIARSEMYDVQIVNDDADRAYEELKAAYLAARHE